MSEYGYGRIESFDELLWWINYDSTLDDDELDFCYKLRPVKGARGFMVNKVMINEVGLSYKTEYYRLADGLFEKLEVMYKTARTMSKMTERST